MSKKGENIYKRKDNRWEARYIKGYRPDGGPKYGYCYGKTYREAREKVAQVDAVKELYYKYFHIPKDGKIRETVMVAKTALTVVILLVCLAGISLTAYAWFSCSTASGIATLIAADFDLDVSVTVTQGGAVKEPNADGTYSLQADSTYSVVLTKTGSASTGFCILEADFGGSKRIYHTQQVGQDGTLYRDTLKFDLVAEDGATVRFTAHWGTSSYYGYENADTNPLYIQDGCYFTLSPAPVQTQSDPATEVTSPTVTPAQITHIVVAGETLADIANRYGSSIDVIAVLNNISDVNMIFPGQVLTIPSAVSVQPAETTAPTEQTQSE